MNKVLGSFVLVVFMIFNSSTVSAEQVGIKQVKASFTYMTDEELLTKKDIAENKIFVVTIPDVLIFDEKDDDSFYCNYKVSTKNVMDSGESIQVSINDSSLKILLSKDYRGVLNLAKESQRDVLAEGDYCMYDFQVLLQGYHKDTFSVDGTKTVFDLMIKGDDT